MQDKEAKQDKKEKDPVEVQADSAAGDEAEEATAEPVEPQKEDTEATPEEQPKAGELEKALESVTVECDSLKDQLLRARAEFDNYRKRTLRETERVRVMATESLIRDLLPVADNLERALDHVQDKDSSLAQGVEMVLKQIQTVFANHGVTPIAALGEAFDPNVHEALSHQPSEEYPADAVAVEFQRGYLLGGQVLRPSKVVVSSGPPNGAKQDSAVGNEETADINSEEKANNQ